ncbi:MULTISPECIES: hypothetical protein [Pseudomonas]|uniref:hypothetical protein n=1 Tax=Pseudomonas TaxID=286 RepID=UPI000802F38C|nr:hypothetical protein [Pseudomonas bananamidigenes]
MPVPHDLYQDLNITKEKIQQIRSQDPHLDALINKYLLADKDVVEAENATSNAPSDDVLRKLKETRVYVKDQIVAQLQPHL